MSHILGIDFGFKRIGVAISDARRKVALPLATVAGGKSAIANILKLVGNRPLLAILVGLPLLLKGERGEMVKQVEIFGAALGQAFDVPVIYLDERLSTKGAEQSLKEISLNRKEINEKLDMVAATMMLQTYLDRNSHDQ